MVVGDVACIVGIIKDDQGAIQVVEPIDDKAGGCLALFVQAKVFDLLFGPQVIQKDMVKKRHLSFDQLENLITEKWIHDPELNKVSIHTGEHGIAMYDNLKRAKVSEYIFYIFKNISDLRATDQELLKIFTLLPIGDLSLIHI